MVHYKKFILTLLLLSLFSCVSTVENFVSNYEGDVEYYNYNGIDVKYSDVGSGVPIIFIHGLGANSFTWRHLYKYYSLEYRVISIDLMGFGQSDKPLDKKYLISEQADLVSSFIKDKNLDKVILVGNSLGGSVCLYTYFDIKDRIGSMVLLNPAVYATEAMPSYVVLLQTPLINKLALKISPKNVVADLALRKIVYNNSKITKEMITNYSLNLEDSGTQNALIRSVGEGSVHEVNYMATNYDKVDIPVLIIWGREDHIINVNEGKKLHDDIPDSQLVILEKCGHIPQEEDPERTITTIDKFINRM